ncbi:MAG: DUF2330 domain-containing protein [Phycisphaerae bacterium]|nr:DUF2330 domain-containing protein [Phycisphaerae bacterium]
MTTQAPRVLCPFLLVLLVACPAIADGVYFLPVGEAADLAQTRQEAVLAHYDGKTTYVLRTMYTGSPDSFAWVMPLPAIPTDVVAHDTSALFTTLDEITSPVFFSIGPARGCGCSLDTGDAARNGLVTVVASGQAGIFDWAALTSTGANALLTWLNTNGFAVPSSATTILDAYIQQEMFFLAVRVADPANLAPNAQNNVQIPPIQFTCEVTSRFYPMIISRITAAQQTEVLLYVIAPHRAEAANVPNALIDRQSIAADPNSDSGTNYEQLFTDKIAELGGLALITEFASHLDYLSSYDYVNYAVYQADDIVAAWPDIPQDLTDPNGNLTTGLFLTRMRTVLAPNSMTVDFEFQDANTDDSVSREFWFTAASKTGAASLLAQPAALLAVCALFHAGLRRRNRKPHP